MSVFRPLQLVVTVSALLCFSSATAQDARDDSTNVWIAVEAQWDAEENGDKDWIDRMLSDNFFGWTKETPAPRSKSSTKMWDRLNDQQGEMVAHELYPLEIVVEGDTAIAHYLYSSAFEDKDGEVETRHGRYTDVLIRTEEGWRFLGWHGGAD